MACCLPAIAATPAATRTGGGKVVGWRGDGSGQYPDANLPAPWDVDEGTGILWRATIGAGQSTPLVVGNKVIVAVEQDLLVCVGLGTGKLLWKLDNGFACLPADQKAPEKRYPIGKGGGYAVPTPVTDGRRVFASYGTGIVIACDLAGNRQWVRHIGLPQVTEYGRSASPRLVADKLVVSVGALIALDPNTGKVLWTCRDAKPSYGTPAIASIGGTAAAITPNGDCVRIADGKLLAAGLAKTQYSSPIVHDGVVYFACAHAAALELPKAAARLSSPKSGEPLAFRKLWENKDLEGEFFASPICHGGLLYCLSNDGILYALDARGGQGAWKQKLPIASADPAPGRQAANLYASIALIGGRLLMANDAGESLILAPGRQYRELGRGYLDGGSGACPAPVGGRLLLRGGDKLLLIGR